MKESGKGLPKKKKAGKKGGRVSKRGSARKFAKEKERANPEEKAQEARGDYKERTGLKKSV